MAYNPRPFDYSLRPYDAIDLSVETADILDVRDNQLTNYLQNETTAIQSEINSIVSAPGDWDTSFVPTLRRGSTTVTTSVATSAYCQNAYLVFFKCELEVTSTVSFPGDQIISISLPVACSTDTRVLGTGMYLDGDASPVFYLFKAFIEDFSVNNQRAVFIVDRGLNWLGQNVTGSPTISGVRTGDRWYLDVCYRPA